MRAGQGVRKFAVLGLSLGLGGFGSGAAAEPAAVPAKVGVSCQGPSAFSQSPWTFSLRADNDRFGGSQDQGYTNGVVMTLQSPDVVAHAADPCLPALAQALYRHLGAAEGGFTQQKLLFSLGQYLYTPREIWRTELIPEDRPYAGVLLFSLGYNARRGQTLHSTHLRVGMVGPSALGRQVHTEVHKITNSIRPQGWSHQLRDEWVLQLAHERMHRWAGAEHSGGWGWDAVAHWGGALGTLSSYVNAGLTLRYGFQLPDDFGSSALRPAGEHTGAEGGPSRASTGWAGHAFVSSDVRWVFNDLTLNGNTFKSSHSVPMRHGVGELSYGVAFTHGLWKLALSRTHRTREFRGQESSAVFGSVTISRQF